MNSANPISRASARVFLVILLGVFAASVAPLPLVPTAAAASARPALTGVVNINTASADELQLLPGVGRSRAAAIVQLRKERGGFKRVDDLTAVSGIGETMLDTMRPHLTLMGKTTARRGPGEASAGKPKGRDAAAR